MISPEQIDANIAALVRRRQAASERDRARAVRHVHYACRERYPEYNGKLIGFVVHTRKGYKPFIGRPMNSSGDNDSLINVVDSPDPQETLEQALAFFAPDRDKFALVLAKPVPNGSMMGHWLSSMMAAQQ